MAASRSSSQQEAAGPRGSGTAVVATYPYSMFKLCESAGWHELFCLGKRHSFYKNLFFIHVHSTYYMALSRVYFFGGRDHSNLCYLLVAHLSQMVVAGPQTPTELISVRGGDRVENKRGNSRTGRLLFFL